MRLAIRGGALVVDLEGPHLCLSSAVLGGGMGWARTWLNLQVPPGYSRTDPEAHLAEASAGLAGPVVGMMTAADVAAYEDASSGPARAVATLGVAHALAAAGTRPRSAPRAGTINLLVVCCDRLEPAALAGALAIAVEAKVQALQDARVPAANSSGYATGTATDSICVACPPGGGVAFAGAATRTGSAIARSVYEAIYAGATRRRIEVARRAGSRGA